MIFAAASPAGPFTGTRRVSMACATASELKTAFLGAQIQMNEPIQRASLESDPLRNEAAHALVVTELDSHFRRHLQRHVACVLCLAP